MAAKSRIESAGGRALRLTASRALPSKGLDGLLLGGGADITHETSEGTLDAMHRTMEESRRAVARGLTPRQTLLQAPALLLLRRILSRSRNVLDPSRDAFEHRWLDHALSREIPVFGICRGAQLVNIHLGGTLHADIGPLLGELPRPRTVLPRVTIDVAKDSRLASHLGATRLSVNALHHQSVKAPAAGFEIVARDRDGIVQAIEEPRHRFLVGVQWHPEYMPQHRLQRNLFESFVSACRGS